MARKWSSVLALSAVLLTAAAPGALAEEDVMPPFGDADKPGIRGVRVGTDGGVPPMEADDAGV
ncbi:MAG: hypothetical protein VCF24_26030 [Candidatus Latescibacterota bacterium]|jgi:hypothetical protein